MRKRHTFVASQHCKDVNNPQDGDLAYGWEIDRCQNRTVVYQWIHCPLCSDPRWTLSTSVGLKGVCRTCAARYQVGRSNKKWKGGRTVLKSGIVMIRVYPDNPYYAMGRGGNKLKWVSKVIPEHRLLMAQHLGRCLESWEIIHHVNGNNADNRIDNLRLVDPDDHCVYSQLQKDNKALVAKINELDINIQVLRLELNMYKDELKSYSEDKK